MAEPQSISQTASKSRLFYGYVVVIAGFFIFVAYSASRTVFGFYFDPMIEEFGWSAAFLSGAFSLSILMDGTLGIVMGKLTDRFGPKRVLIVCGLLGGTGYILVSRVTEIWQMYLLYGIMVGTGMGGVFIPVITDLARWFTTNRNTMNGIMLTGMGVGALAISPIAYWLLSNYGWKTSYVVIGVGFMILVLAGAMFMKQKPLQNSETKLGTIKTQLNLQNRNYSLSEALHTLQFWLVFGMFFCFGYSATSLQVHLVPHILNLDIPSATAVSAGVMAVVGGINIVSRLAYGGIGDKIGSRQAYGLGLMIMSAGVLWLLFISQPWVLYIFAVIWGFSAGGIGTVQTSIVAEFFGVKSIGIIFGVCGLGVMIGGSIGPVVTGYLFDIFNNYFIAFLICGLVTLAGVAVNLILARRKIR